MARSARRPTGRRRRPRKRPVRPAVRGQLRHVRHHGAVAYRKLRLWRNTAVASSQPGQTLTLGPGTGTLGYEWDEDVDNGFRPAGEFDLSSTTVSGVQAFTDYGSTLNTNATATHHLTLYRAPSGAIVFGAGTVQWSWGLDNTNAWGVGTTDPSGNPPDPNMQQFTVNLLAEMGAQPGSLSPGLDPAAQSTDTTPPTSTITSPSSGESPEDGSAVTVSGSAKDGGGGVVAGVEVSTDGGTTWHPATLTSPDGQTVSWSYRWVVHGFPRTTIRSRAADDSANLETPGPGVSVNVSCPCSIWGNAVTPSVPDSGDPRSVELGVAFTSQTFGTVNGIRFYKSAANTGTHIGSLWSASGQRLATATFSNETPNGWQQVTFSNPVDIFPNTTYIASYFAPTGHYAASSNYFFSPPATGGSTLNSPPLHAALATATAGNGIYAYSPTSTFPSSTFNGSNYWVDPVFVPAVAPGQVTNVSGVAGPGSVALTWSAPSSGGPVTSYTVTPYIGAEAQHSVTVTGTPPSTGLTVTGLTPGTEYTFTVQASNPNGAGPASSRSSAVVPSATFPPSAPTAVTATGASSAALVTWTPSSGNGGAITGYVVTPYVGTTAGTSVEVGASATAATVKGLTNGTTYTFTVTALNAYGSSPPSAASNAVIPEDTIFDFGTPATVDSADSHSVVIGVKFTSSQAGAVTGIRFYKAAANTGTHIGSLWSSTGVLLASATFSGESASGWQQVRFSSPVSISANTTYVASYLAPKGHYSDTASGFSAGGVSNPPLSALGNAVSADGVYTYSSTNAFPTSSYKATNYWVDLDFLPTPPPGRPTAVKAAAGPGSAVLKWTPPSAGGPVTEYVITPYIGATPQTSTLISGAPPASSTTIKGLTNGVSYTFTVQAFNANGGGPVSEQSNAITPTALTAPSAPLAVTASGASSQALVSWSVPVSEGGSEITTYVVTPYLGASPQTPIEVPASSTSLLVEGLVNADAYSFTVIATNAVGSSPPSSPSNTITPQDTLFNFRAPTVVDSADTAPTEVGVKFRSQLAGTITGLRFYKGAANTGTHIGSLWTASGSPLASATFSGETASGWQQVELHHSRTDRSGYDLRRRLLRSERTLL